MLTIRPESYSECIDEMKLMYPAHYEELSRTKQKPLSPQYDIYNSMEAAGLLHVIAVRSDDVLVGYLMFVITPDLHYGGISALEDIYYLKPEFRGKMIGKRMFEAFEKEAKRLGAWKITVSTKIHRDNSRLFERCGMSEHEKVFVKVL